MIERVSDNLYKLYEFVGWSQCREAFESTRNSTSQAGISVAAVGYRVTTPRCKCNIQRRSCNYVGPSGLPLFISFPQMHMANMACYVSPFGHRTMPSLLNNAERQGGRGFLTHDSVIAHAWTCMLTCIMGFHRRIFHCVSITFWCVRFKSFMNNLMNLNLTVYRVLVNFSYLRLR